MTDITDTGSLIESGALFGVTTPDLPPLDGESRAVTVKLPQAVSAGGQGYQEQVERILTAAGIKVEVK